MSEMMKAIVYEKYGPPEVLHLKEAAKPVPADDEVLVKVHATTVTIGDCRMRKFEVPKAQWMFARLYLGLFSPRRKVLGMELAGVIETVGKQVTRFKVGDEVFANTINKSFGGYAEYKCFREHDAIALKPQALTFGEAAASVGGGGTALRCLDYAKLKTGQKILIYGASGAVGSNAVQLAANLFEAKVTAVCSTSNVAWVKALGAETVLDYTSPDFHLEENHNDVFLDAVSKFPQEKAHRALRAGGTYVNVHNSKHTKSTLSPTEELERLRDLLETGKFKPHIDRVYSLQEIIEAHHYVEQGHKKGNVVISIQSKKE
jgi:NADPH:quinone reductase-like Zn-dependent oxidoreductase